MDDLPIPESGGEALVLLVFVAVLIGLWFLIRGTQRRHREEYRARRTRAEFYRTHRRVEPDDPTQLSDRWEPIPEDTDG